MGVQCCGKTEGGFEDIPKPSTIKVHDIDKDPRSASLGTHDDPQSS